MFSAPFPAACQKSTITISPAPFEFPLTRDFWATGAAQRSSGSKVGVRDVLMDRRLPTKQPTIANSQHSAKANNSSNNVRPRDCHPSAA